MNTCTGDEPERRSSSCLFLNTLSRIKRTNYGLDVEGRSMHTSSSCDRGACFVVILIPVKLAHRAVAHA